MTRKQTKKNNSLAWHCETQRSSYVEFSCCIFFYRIFFCKFSRPLYVHRAYKKKRRPSCKYPRAVTVVWWNEKSSDFFLFFSRYKIHQSVLSSITTSPQRCFVALKKTTVGNSEVISFSAMHSTKLRVDNSLSMVFFEAKHL